MILDCAVAAALTVHQKSLTQIDQLVRAGKAELYSKAGRRYVRIFH